MPLVTTTEMFKKAYEGGYAIGAFNVNNMEIVQAITEAANELRSPIILQCSAGARKYIEAGKDLEGKGFDPRKLLAPGAEAIKATVKEKMELFGSVGKAE